MQLVALEPLEVSVVLEYGNTSAVAALSELDREILRLVAEGRTSKEIGRALDRSHYTIDDRLKQVCRLLGADSRAQAAVMLLREEAAAPPPDLGGTPQGGIEAGVGYPPHGREDGGSRHGQGLKDLTTSLTDPRLGQLATRLLLILVGVAVAAFLLANAIEAVQGVFLTVLRG
jgi:DNA-binding CsgD family transcriptional regulator